MMPAAASCRMILVVSLVVILIYSGLGACQEDGDLNNSLEPGTCETLPSSIHVTKEEMDGDGNVVRVCEGDITVSKCEGTCSSQLKPSVASQTGFHKQCFCCRESWMKQRTILLTDCFTPDGVRLEDPGLRSLQISMQEPEGCECHKCGT